MRTKLVGDARRAAERAQATATPANAVKPTKRHGFPALDSFHQPTRARAAIERADAYGSSS